MMDDYCNDPRTNLHSACDPVLLKAWHEAQMDRIKRRQAELDKIFDAAKTNPALKRRLDKPIR